MTVCTRVLLLLTSLWLSRAAFPQQTAWSEEAAELRKHVELWRSKNISTYRYLADSRCFGCYRYFPAIVSVGDGNVVAIIDPDTGNLMRSKTVDGETLAIFPDNISSYLTIERLFEIIDEAISNPDGIPRQSGLIARVITVEYDESYGYPVSVFIEYGHKREPGTLSRTMHANFSMTVSNFTP